MSEESRIFDARVAAAAVTAAAGKPRPWQSHQGACPHCGRDDALVHSFVPGVLRCVFCWAQLDLEELDALR